MGFGLGSLNPLGWTAELADKIVGEDTMSKVPVVGSLLGAESNERKALRKKQQEMGADFKKRQRMNERARMNALGQKMLAFAPQSQMMAQMFGPEAAFSPQQMGAMSADPMAMNQEQLSAMHAEGMKTGGSADDYIRERDRMAEDQKRRAGVEAAFAPTQGPAPLQKVKPQAARRY